MKFNSRIKEKLIDFSSKVVLLALAGLICLWMISGARAATGDSIAIDSIEHLPGDGSKRTVEFIFTAPVDKRSIKVDLQRNFVQLSLKGVTAFPAKTKRIDDDLLDKVFTYQYQPDLARARVLLKTQASNISDGFSWEIDGSKLRLFVTEPVAGVAKVQEKVKLVASSTAKTETNRLPEEEQAVRQIIEETKSAPVTTPKASTNSEDQPLFADTKAESGVAKASSSSAQPPAAKVFATLLMVLGLIGAIAMGYKKFVLGRGLGSSKRDRMIQVIASQALGPKRSIAVVKVLDQVMVVGMSGDGMSLLSNLGSDVNIEKFHDDPLDDSSFSNTFQRSLKQDAPEAPETKDAGIRNTIKKRLSGFKPLRTQ